MNLSGKGAMVGAVGGLLGGAAVGYLAGEGTKAVAKRTATGAVVVGLLGAAGGALLGPAPAQSASNVPTQGGGGGGGGGGTPAPTNVEPTNQAASSMRRGPAGLPQLSPRRAYR